MFYVTAIISFTGSSDRYAERVRPDYFGLVCFGSLPILVIYPGDCVGVVWLWLWIYFRTAILWILGWYSLVWDFLMQGWYRLCGWVPSYRGGAAQIFRK
ncbi:vegetative cell wall protein gp1-like [Iris pallida]|uniref:Vegetative cell wall protein gp1-like n=1 Tax=Iris pallida TaxID=29817 RepID=A0AAX6ESM3_IRIPA|nr:vegetative cell wall protein gp1-like [Iris pallida]